MRSAGRRKGYYYMYYMYHVFSEETSVRRMQEIEMPIRIRNVHKAESHRHRVAFGIENKKRVIHSEKLCRRLLEPRVSVSCMWQIPRRLIVSV